MNYPSYPNLIIEEPILRDFSEDSSFKYPLQSDSQVARQIANIEKKQKDPRK